MTVDEIGLKLVDQFKNTYQFQYGQWLIKRDTRWVYIKAPRLQIALALREHIKNGVEPSQASIDAVQRYLETYFDRGAVLSPMV